MQFARPKLNQFERPRNSTTFCEETPRQRIIVFQLGSLVSSGTARAFGVLIERIRSFDLAGTTFTDFKTHTGDGLFRVHLFRKEWLILYHFEYIENPTLVE